MSFEMAFLLKNTKEIYCGAKSSVTYTYFKKGTNFDLSISLIMCNVDDSDSNNASQTLSTMGPAGLIYGILTVNCMLYW